MTLLAALALLPVANAWTGDLTLRYTIRDDEAVSEAFFERLDLRLTPAGDALEVRRRLVATESEGVRLPVPEHYEPTVGRWQIVGERIDLEYTVGYEREMARLDRLLWLRSRADLRLGADWEIGFPATRDGWLPAARLALRPVGRPEEQRYAVTYREIDARPLDGAGEMRFTDGLLREARLNLRNAVLPGGDGRPATLEIAYRLIPASATD